MIVYICLFLLFLCSCHNTPKDSEVIRVSVLRGPSAIVFAGWMKEAPVIDGKRLSVQFVDAPDLMQALLIKGETDLAALPITSAANLYNRGIRYPLLGCPVWGTLYLTGRKESAPSSPASTVCIFGAGTTPDILTRYYLQQHNLDYSLNYTFGTASEMMQGLLAGKIHTAVLSEPFLSLALRKDSTLHLLADLNNQDASTPGFPQTAIVYAPSLTEKRTIIDSLLHVSCRFATENPEQAIRILEKEGVFTPGMLTPKSIERCKIRYVPAGEAKEDIIRFLQLIEHYEPKALNGKLPDEGFYK